MSRPLIYVLYTMHAHATGSYVSQWPGPMVSLITEIIRAWPRKTFLLDVLYELHINSLEADIPVGNRPD